MMFELEYAPELIDELKVEILNDIGENTITIKVLPYDVTEEITKVIKEEPKIRCAVISIDDYGFPPTEIAEGTSIVGIHKMKFADLDVEDASTFSKFMAKPKDLAGLKDFVDSIKNKCNLIIVHCAAGISRSPAVASALEEYLGMPDTIWNSDDYCPNGHVYRLARKEFGTW